ncbi:hypothetical protein [Paenibacillus sp. IHBB 3054]|uniref:hypothetical protein n=1 Tax=Paenibacillus sp. IHBB 3054 TaxID=3425689 RepID=UPI003F67507E
MYKVILGFYSESENRRYRVGDVFKGRKKERIDELVEQGLIEPQEGDGVVTDDDAGKRKDGPEDKLE